MRRLLTAFLWALLIGAGLVSKAQVTLTPSYPTIDQPVTITYDAAAGNGALAGASSVYMHSGVVLTGPTGTAWSNTVGNWGQDDGIGKMTAIGDNKWQITLTPRTYYGITASQNVFRLSMVFRNPNGTLAGKTADNGDIYVNVDPGFYVLVNSPTGNDPFTVTDKPFTISATASAPASMKIFIGNTAVKTVKKATTISHTVTFTRPGVQNIRIITSSDGDVTTIEKRITLTVVNKSPVAALPAGVKDGINYVDDKTVILSLLAPGKDFVFVTGDFNAWKTDAAYQMKKTPDGERFWLQLGNLVPQKEYVFQYLVNGNLRIADPYTDKVADPWNDASIPAETYPGLPSYTNTAYGIAGVLQTAQKPYDWKVKEFKAPAKEKLVAYELLIRDFTAAHSYQSVIDSIQYLKNLGINAIELMPVNEFEGNESWGYNPSFFFAPDKYYGHKDKLKELIDVAHANGMAVIIDMVLNHAFGQNVMARMYWDEANNRPAADNPWFNPVAPNTCFFWGNDFNHQSKYTQQFIDRVNSYWLTEYKVDGFRFDFTKGFTNNDVKNCGSDYDQQRVDILNRMAGTIWNVNPNAYVILEHLTDKSEEDKLAEAGMLLWRRVDPDYKEVIAGWQLNRSFEQAKSDSRVAYMESHDEERIMIQSLHHGNDTQPGYNVKDTTVALDRLELGAAFLYTVPGPKMIWMFGEQGYDYSIDFNGRVGNKPLVWSQYMRDPRRVDTYRTVAALLNLRKDHPVFTEGAFTWKTDAETRWINIRHESMNVVIVGNFDVVPRTFKPSFPHTGRWHNYFKGMDFMYGGGDITLAPGEWMLLTDKKLPMPAGFKPANVVTATPAAFTPSDEVTITFDARQASGNLVGAQKVYMHSGVVLSGPDGTEFNNTVGNWGQDDGVGEMKSIGNDKWQITLTPAAYYKLSSDQQVFRLAMVFRDASGNNTGKGPAFSDLFLDVKLPPLAAPSGLTAAAAGVQVSLKWLDNASAETAYVVERSTTSGSGFAQVASLPANATTYTDDNVPAGSFFYRVRAIGEGNAQSLNSNEATATVGAGFTVYFYKPADWNAANVYYWDAQPAGAMPGTGWPGPAMTAAPDQGDNWYKFEFPSVTSTNLIFNNNGNGQTADLSRNKDGWYRDGKWYDQKPAELIIHFKKPWYWTKANIYYWNVTPAGIAPDAGWPGAAMQDDGNGWFSFRIVGATGANMIFNDGGQNQTTDLTRSGSGWFADGGWFNAQPKDLTIHFKKPADWNTAFMHFWNVTPAGTLPGTNWPGVPMKDDGDGWYSYTLAGITCVNIVFNNNASPQTGDLSRCGDGWYANGTWTDQKPAARLAADGKQNAIDGVTLSQNRPNPVDRTTTISFTLPAAQQVALKVYDGFGKEVSTLAQGEFAQGAHSVTMETRGLRAGVYLYRLTTGGQVLTRKLVKN